MENKTERLNCIKKEFQDMRRLYKMDEWQKGDKHLYRINDNGHLKWLIEQAEILQAIEKKISLMEKGCI